MRRLTTIIAIALIFLSNRAFAEDIAKPLKLIKALPVEGVEGSEPSGLTIFNGTLFTISDKHDDTIFRIELIADKAVLVPHIQFKLSEPVTEKGLDFEGITCDEEGNFYIASETTFRILRVSTNGDKVSWETESLRSYGEEVGLFQTRGAYLEGIAYVGKKRFVVSAERQPRGIIEIDTNEKSYKANAFKYDKTKAVMPEGRDIDFAGLFSENNILYTLNRSSCVICKLVHDEQGFEEKDLWSFKEIAESDTWRYTDNRFGKAEGFCMDTSRVYVILDNNKDSRYSNPNDKRPLLLIMERPKATD